MELVGMVRLGAISAPNVHRLFIASGKGGSPWAFIRDYIGRVSDLVRKRDVRGVESPMRQPLVHNEV